MCSIVKASALVLTGLFAAVVGACGPVPEDPECGQLREIGRSEVKSKLIRDWIESTLTDPSSLAQPGFRSGRLLARDFDSGLDWDILGIPRDDAVIEFYGESVDYADLQRSAVDAVVISRGYTYKLIFKLTSATSLEEKLMEDSKKPYGQISMEQIGSDLVLVCQVNE